MPRLIHPITNLTLNRLKGMNVGRKTNSQTKLQNKIFSERSNSANWQCFVAVGEGKVDTNEGHLIGNFVGEAITIVVACIDSDCC